MVVPQGDAAKGSAENFTLGFADKGIRDRGGTC